jgi:hypothetical protein
MQPAVSGEGAGRRRWLTLRNQVLVSLLALFVYVCL